MLDRPVTIAAFELSAIDVPPVGKEDMRLQLCLLCPQQFLTGFGDLAQLCLFGACSHRARMAGHTEIDGWKRGLRLRLYSGVTIGAAKTIFNMFGVVESDRLTLRGAGALMGDDCRARQSKEHDESGKTRM